eukprot:gene24998-biopygen11958
MDSHSSTDSWCMATTAGRYAASAVFPAPMPHESEKSWVIMDCMECSGGRWVGSARRSARWRGPRWGLRSARWTARTWAPRSAPRWGRGALKRIWRCLLGQHCLKAEQMLQPHTNRRAQTNAMGGIEKGQAPQQPEKGGRGTSAEVLATSVLAVPTK